MRSALAWSVGLLLLVPTGTAFLSLGLMWESGGRTDAALLVGAGRLSRRAIELGDWAERVAQGQAQDRAGLRDRADAFERALAELQRAEVRAPVARGALAELDTVWRDLSPRLQAVVKQCPAGGAAPAGRELAVALAALRERAEGLGVALEGGLEAARQGRLRTLATLLGVNLGVLLLGLLYARRSAMRRPRGGDPSARVPPLGGSREPERVGRGVHRVSEQVESLLAHPALLLSAIEQSCSVVMITDRRRRITYVNPQFSKTTGYARDEVIGENPRMLQSGETPREVYRDLWTTLESGRDWHGTFSNRGKDGALFWWSATISPVVDADGAVTHYVAVNEDVTQRRELEGRAIAARRLESIGRLAGGVAHDFNNILMAIMGYVDLALEGEEDLSDELREDLEEIRSATRRAADLTRQLLAFGRKQVLQPRALDLNELVGELLKMLTRVLEERIEVVTALDPGIRHAMVDPAQVDQVLMNLVVNARDAMPGGGRLSIETSSVTLDDEFVRAHPGARPGAFVLLAVSDTGVGMDEATVRQVFEPFFTTKAEGDGTGLGLATVHGIVQQSGGFIDVSSELGNGSRFRVYFPEATVERRRRTTPRVRSLHPGCETILIVEDDESVGRLALRILGDAGYQILEAAGADAALRICGSHAGPIHLLLTDVVMPTMSGPALAERVRLMRPDVTVVFMSGYAPDADGALVTEAAFVQKPLSPEALTRALRAVLDGD